LHCGEKISGEFVVAGGNGAKVLNFIEEALDEVALAVECEIAIALGLSIGFGGITGVISRSARLSMSGSAS
jgi:hypothetical protein